MPGEAVELLEGVGVKKGLDALHRGQLALGVLLVDGGLAASDRFGTPTLEVVGLVLRSARDRGTWALGCGHMRTLAP